MKIYLTLGAIPELSALPPSERRVAYHQCSKSAARCWQVWAGTLLGLILGAAAGIGALYLIVEWQPVGRLFTYFLGGFVCGALIVGISGFVRTIFIAHYIRPYLRTYLAEKTAGRSERGPGGPGPRENH